MIDRPSDLLDSAAALTQRIADAGVQAVLESSKGGIKPKGFCYNCDEQVDRLFCDEDCRDDYEWRMERKRVNGG